MLKKLFKRSKKTKNNVENNEKVEKQSNNTPNISPNPPNINNPPKKNIVDNIKKKPEKNIKQKIIPKPQPTKIENGIESNNEMSIDQTDNKSIEIDDNNNEFNDSNDDEFNDNEFSNNEFDENDDDWGDMKLQFGQKELQLEKDEEDGDEMLKRALEKKRIMQSDKSKFWNCGKCGFMNHPSRAICMACQMPQLDIVHHVLTCKEKLKKCANCCALVIPDQYADHCDTCQPMPGIDGKNQNWYCDLTECEKNAVNHVTSKAMEKSNANMIKESLIKKFQQINIKYDKNTLKQLQSWFEWQAPIIIRVHVAKLIPKLMKDTQYRNLFEIGTGSGGNDKNRRKLEEGKMFGPVYDKAKASERPKYGCLNVGLKAEGDLKAKSYGDGYFLMNDTTIRWRSTMTIGDSFGVNGNCGTLKHCLHLLNELTTDELQELIDAALYSKQGGDKQRQYREVQIHGPVILNRDVISLHCPNNQKKFEKIFQEFCKKNNCKLVWF